MASLGSLVTPTRVSRDIIGIPRIGSVRQPCQRSFINPISSERKRRRFALCGEDSPIIGGGW